MFEDEVCVVRCQVTKYNRKEIVVFVLLYTWRYHFHQVLPFCFSMSFIDLTFSMTFLGFAFSVGVPQLLSSCYMDTPLLGVYIPKFCKLGAHLHPCTYGVKFDVEEISNHSQYVLISRGIRFQMVLNS